MVLGGMSILRRIKDTKFTLDDVIKFVLKEDVFQTALSWKANFISYIQRLYDENFIVIFGDRDIEGLCCWALINEDNEDDLNKIRWTLPNEIKNGDILYIGICILSNPCHVWKIRKFLKGNTFVDKAKEAIWFREGWHRRRIIKCRS